MQNEAYLAVLRDILAGDVAPEKMQDSVFVDSVSQKCPTVYLGLGTGFGPSVVRSSSGRWRPCRLR